MGKGRGGEGVEISYGLVVVGRGGSFDGVCDACGFRARGRY